MKGYYVGRTEIDTDGENMSVAPEGAVGEIHIPEDATIYYVQSGFVYWYAPI